MATRFDGSLGEGQSSKVRVQKLQCVRGLEGKLDLELMPVGETG